MSCVIDVVHSQRPYGWGAVRRSFSGTRTPHGGGKQGTAYPDNRDNKPGSIFRRLRSRIAQWVVLFIAKRLLEVSTHRMDRSRDSAHWSSLQLVHSPLVSDP